MRSADHNPRYSAQPPRQVMPLVHCGSAALRARRVLPTLVGAGCALVLAACGSGAHARTTVTVTHAASTAASSSSSGTTAASEAQVLNPNTVSSCLTGDGNSQSIHVVQDDLSAAVSRLVQSYGGMGEIEDLFQDGGGALVDEYFFPSHGIAEQALHSRTVRGLTLGRGSSERVIDNDLVINHGIFYDSDATFGGRGRLSAGDRRIFDQCHGIG